MSFNSSDIQSFKNVWVFCEQRQGEMMPTTFELISEGRKLADELGVELCGILLGDNVDGIAAELGNYGADKVYVYNSPLLKDFTTDGYTKVIVEAVEELKPEVLLFDEPTSALDPELTGEVLKVIRGLAEQKTTMIIVTHEMAFARDVGDQVIFMDGGFIVEQGDPHQVIDHPQELRTQQFLSRFSENN